MKRFQASSLVNHGGEERGVIVKWTETHMERLLRRESPLSSPPWFTKLDAWNLFILFYNLSFQLSASLTSLTCILTQRPRHWKCSFTSKTTRTTSSPLDTSQCFCCPAVALNLRDLVGSCSEHPKASSIFHQGAGYNIADKNRASANPERQKLINDFWVVGGRGRGKRVEVAA